MTLAHRPAAAPRAAASSARLEVAWTLSASAIAPGRGYSSAVLHVELAWDPSDEPARPTVSACIIRGPERRAVALPGPVTLDVQQRGQWTHLAASVGQSLLLQASFERGRLAYCTGALPSIAGLPGGAYDAPTGLLERYVMHAALPEAHG